MVQHERDVNELLGRLQDRLGEALRAVVLYGPEAHGDEYRAIGDVQLMIVVDELSPGTMRAMREAVRRWLKTGQPWPRLFTPATIRESADVFPIEFLDISRHHRVLHGEDPLADLDVEEDHLRLQCERELREKLMRLQEGYVECRKDKELRALIAASFTSFATVFRGCLHLLGEAVPTRDRQVAALFCKRLELDASPFEAVEALSEGAAQPADLDALFARYYAQLQTAVSRVDRFGGQTP